MKYVITITLAILLFAGIALAKTSQVVRFLSTVGEVEVYTLAESEGVELYKDHDRYYLTNTTDSVRYVKVNRVERGYNNSYIEVTLFIYKLSPNESESINFEYDWYNLHIKAEDGWVGLIRVHKCD